MSVPEDVTITGDEWEMFPEHHDWRVNAMVSLLRQSCEELQHSTRMLETNMQSALRLIRLMPAATTEVDKAKDSKRMKEYQDRINFYTERQGRHINKILELLPYLNHTYLHNPPHEEDDA